MSLINKMLQDLDARGGQPGLAAGAPEIKPVAPPERSFPWLRVALQAPEISEPEWLLELAYPPLDRRELYTPIPQGGWERQVAGDLQPFAERPLSHRNHVLPVWLPARFGTATDSR